VPKTPSDAFDVKDSAFKGRWKDRADFVLWLSNELDLAISARSGVASEIRHNWDYYEQNRMRANNAPWPDAADLPSPYAPEYTDAVHARLMQTIFVENVWSVEGFGPSASRAPFVEEFHQKAQEDERLQQYADEWVLRGLIEGVGTLEITEAVETRREIQRKRVALQLDPLTQAPILGEDGPELATDPESGDYVATDDPAVPSAEVDIDVEEPVRLGPEYDVIPYADFGVLPAHARNRKQVWGYWKRFHRRVPELQHCVKKGIYDKDGVEKAGTDNDFVNQSDTAPRLDAAPVSQDGPTAQKELFECQVLADIDGKGERWWRVTLQKDRRALLRLKYDDRTTRYIRWMPFPKPGTMDRGYSLIGNKLITVLEEDTARRNMTADRMAMVAGQPIKKLQGSLWDEFEQPFGPRAVITVRDMKEVEPMAGIQDVPASVMNWRSQIRDDADRLIGQNDVAQGQVSEEKRTLGEVQLVAGYAEVRVNLLIKRLQEPMEELGLARHNIWKRTLASNPNLPPQRALVIGREAQGIDQPYVGDDGTVTAEMLEGVFWFKPRGSVETADLNRQRQDFVGLLQVLPGIVQMSPTIGAIFQTVPAAKALVENLLRVFRWPDRQSFIGSEANSVFDLMQQQQEMARDPQMQILMAMAGGGGMGGGMPQGQLPPGQAQGDPMAGGPPQGLM
jgi:hypothetical protein